MQRKLDESKNIINYLKFQRIPFNKDLPKVLESYIFNKDGFKNLKKKYERFNFTQYKETNRYF